MRNSAVLIRLSWLSSKKRKMNFSVDSSVEGSISRIPWKSSVRSAL